MLKALVLDPSAVIPCGNKPEKEKSAIVKLGNLIPKLKTTVYFSRYLIKLYRQDTVKELRSHRMLPRFQQGIVRTIRYLEELAKYSRSRLCKDLKINDLELSIHILESSKVEKFRVEDLGLKSKDDREVLKIGLTVSNTGLNTYIITADNDFFKKLDYVKLKQRYPEESKKLLIKTPREFLRTIYEELFDIPGL